MSFTKTSICNMAISHCGSSTFITGNVDDDNTNEAVICKIWYDHCLSILLEMLPWDFCKRRVALTNLGTPPDGWNYRYMYPNNCKRINKIINPASRNPSKVSDKIEYEVVDISDNPGTGKAILTDQEDAEIEYNEYIINPEQFSAIFVTAFSLFIASFVSKPLRADQSITDGIKKEWAIWLAEAQVQFKSQQQEAPEQDSEFEQARG